MGQRFPKMGEDNAKARNELDGLQSTEDDDDDEVISMHPPA